MKILNGTIARPTYRCIHPVTKEVGDWLFTGDNHKDETAIVSPLFDNFGELAQWAQLNHWEAITGSDGQLAYIYKAKGGGQ